MKKIQILWLTVLLCLATLAPAFARDIQLSWDPSSDPNVIGYKVYYQGGSATLPLAGTDATNGASPIDAGNATSFTITGLNDSQIYYFVVSAYTADGAESAPSDQVASQWVPSLTFPTDKTAKLPANIQLLWDAPPAGSNAVTYTLYYGTDSNLSAAPPVTGAAKGSGAAGKALFAAFALFGLAFPFAPRLRLRRRFAPAAVAAALLMCACGSGGDTLPGSPSDSGGTSATGTSITTSRKGTVVGSGLNDTSYDLTDLAPSTT